LDPLSPLTLVALASGYLFTTRFHLTSYQAGRHSGYHLLFHAACWGIGFLAVSQLVLIATSTVWPDSGSWVRWLRPGLQGSGPFALAFVLSLVLPWVANQAYSRERAAQRVIHRQGSQLERLLYDSQASTYPVSISLKNEKVYIGWPVLTPEPMHRIQDIRILPVASGFRDPVTKALTISTEYFPVYRAIERGALRMDPEDFEIVIALDEVRSANQFSLDIDQDLFRPGDSHREPVPTNG
jgi:hypothetical protein